MARNPDPKPGRWILPLVVLGMVFFTWAFVQRLDPGEVDDAAPVSTTTTSVVETTEADDAEPTTTTTIPAPLAAYLEQIVGDQETLEGIETGMDAVNSGWEDRENTNVTFSESVEAFETLIANTEVFRDSVSIHLPPSGFGDALGRAHQDALSASELVLTEVGSVLDGLRAPDTGEDRRAAMLRFRAAVEEFNLTADNIAIAVQAAALGA